MTKIDIKNFIIPLVALFGLVFGGVLHFLGYENIDRLVWLATVVVGAILPILRMLKDLRHKHFGVDVIAIVAIVTSLALGQYLAGVVIVLMLSGGEALEAYALARARKELTALLANVPTIAHKKTGGDLTDIPVDELKVADIFVVKPGEVVPADGLIISGVSDVDESALTGESVPVEKKPGSQIFSGSINQDGALEIQTLRESKESTYEKIIKLVKQASESRAPVVRLADRYSVWFTAATFIIAIAAWQMSHDPIRLLAVLVVATPCPLILATPAAIMSGVSRAARRGIIVKSGGALEKLAEINAFIFDKTGTLTLGTPEVTEVQSSDGAMNKDIVRIAASLDQLSAHILAASLAQHARKNLNLELDFPQNFQEAFGQGVKGTIKSQNYTFGKLAYLQSEQVNIPAAVVEQHKRLQSQGKIVVYLAENKELLGSIIFADVVRPEIKQLFAQMKNQGMEKIVMLTGDKKNVAEIIAGQLGLTDIHAECLPEDKVIEVQEHKKEFGSVAMVGDGINDAPALAAADVGIAIGGRGSTASSESSDIVITVDDLTRVGEAFKIARRTIAIAKQSIFVGIGVSVVLMVIAAMGHIVPVYGALLQEALDVAVILNALRVNFIKI